jgi:hypothetical protein
MGRSERDFIQAIKLAQEGDQLSVRQMIGGGLVWYQEVGSRVTVLGEGAYSNVLEVRLMDGRKGWIAPRMIERQ